MKRPLLSLHIAVLGVLVLLGTGCPKETRVEPTAPPPPSPRTVQPSGGETGPADADEGADTADLGTGGFREDALESRDDAMGDLGALSAEELNDRGILETVYFDFDSSELSDAALRKLEANAAWLRGNPRFGLVVEGHCDERGTTEYNLSLSRRRASAVRDHLARLGVEASRMELIPYGEERPAVEGRTESAWARNRRAEFKLVNP